MENIESGRAKANVFRGLRPLLWWAMLVLILFGIHTHQVLSERTRLTFSAAIAGRGIFDAMGTIDGRPIQSDEKISLGHHAFTLSHPKAESFTTNLSIWYGPHDLGQINLRRAYGTLKLTATPQTQLLTIRGPECNQTFTNSGGITISLPTDQYSIEARHAHWKQCQEITVLDRVTNLCRIAPRIGSLALSCNRDGASFELLGSDNRIIEASAFPAIISDVPEGNYRLVTQHHRNRREENVAVKYGATNDVQVQLLYGTAMFASEPSGATVLAANGGALGITPLTVSELPVGTLNFTLRLDGYEPAPASLEVAADKTTAFHTNLVSRNYTASVSAAERYFAAEDYEKAEKAAEDALLTKRNDPVALSLRNKAFGFASLRRAEALGKKGDYIAGIKELEKALNALPANSEAEQLLAEFNQRKPEQLERIRTARTNEVRAAFERVAYHSWQSNRREADLFERHELTTAKAASLAEKAIEDALWNINPHFVSPPHTDSASGAFVFEAKQEAADGLRRCIVAGGQITEDTTLIIYEVIEYRNHRRFDVNQNLRFSTTVEHIPLHPSQTPDMTEKQKAQVVEGERVVTECIQRAIQ